jgi:hypothetical protein
MIRRIEDDAAVVEVARGCLPGHDRLGAAFAAVGIPNHAALDIQGAHETLSFMCD